MWLGVILENFLFKRDYWVGNSHDGMIISGSGYHYFRMCCDGLIVEAYEVYENDEGDKIVTPIPDWENVNWINGLGFEDLDEALEDVDEKKFEEIKNAGAAIKKVS